ncbi:hypothetical protein H634G_00109 [Metarhizium anisopliae BRIP 53293]|uniref:Hydrophobin n=1 Tax=Metarhizium anisopliae BRIP 53293 TaxID=1291518 RepID=A0A0D9PEQ0_METAN|nr:hypothetical protein H634G_00109 [Metarhizium anisopliae BRIP 53293]
MISSKIPAYLAFAALIAASPVAITDGEGSVFARGNSVDDCGASTFENHYSNGSPLVAAGASPQISPMAALGPLPISAIVSLCSTAPVLLGSRCYDPSARFQHVSGIRTLSIS